MLHDFVLLKIAILMFFFIMKKSEYFQGKKWTSCSTILWKLVNWTHLHLKFFSVLLYIRPSLRVLSFLSFFCRQKCLFSLFCRQKKFSTNWTPYWWWKLIKAKLGFDLAMLRLVEIIETLYYCINNYNLINVILKLKK